ncbi:glycerate kinase type-2 family protein [Palleronia abyssalis]|uniref:D-glycerate 2-kinase n=1 Tax=Palleronia abyssalis TaxID=1501240 RepID=A0A2R8BYR1_9RHOB|nr:DUF4147 domain-containing protein [Palleronia abyssalis]SPJ25272.1 D-glycerate 2-kinase [Palleronia abyssalis]
MDDLRDTARRAFWAAVTRADPEAAVRRGMDDVADLLDAPGVTVLALGKSALPMARTAVDLLGAKIAGGVAVAPSVGAIPGIEVIVGGHPVPDAGSIAGGTALLRSATRATGPILCLVSGGGSALAEAPIEGIDLAELRQVNELLLKAGADIHRMNVVRGAISRLKAGGLARAANGRLVALILSDVPGDAPRIVASGPTAKIAPDPLEARRILEDLALWQSAPPSVRHAIEQARPVAPGVARNVIVGGNEASILAAEDALTGWPVRRWSGWTDGDVADVADRIVEVMAGVRGPFALVAGGEPTVRVTGNGSGGRNQELALRVAVGLARLDRDWVFLSGGTDGRDGPTDAAGAVVDRGSLDRMAAAGINAANSLARNDSYPALKASSDLLMTGPTGTNVADIMVGLIR